MNRLRYDACEYKQALAQSVDPVSHVIDPVRFEHCSMCRPAVGIVGGTAVSHVTGNLVDLENNLIGIDRPGIQCADYMHHPPTVPGEPVRGIDYIKSGCHPTVQTQAVHLPVCQFASYPEVPQPPQSQPFTCGSM